MLVIFQDWLSLVEYYSKQAHVTLLLKRMNMMRHETGAVSAVGSARALQRILPL